MKNIFISKMRVVVANQSHFVLPDRPIVSDETRKEFESKVTLDSSSNRIKSILELARDTPDIINTLVRQHFDDSQTDASDLQLLETAIPRDVSMFDVLSETEAQKAEVDKSLADDAKALSDADKQSENSKE